MMLFVVIDRHDGLMHRSIKIFKKNELLIQTGAWPKLYGTVSEALELALASAWLWL